MSARWLLHARQRKNRTLGSDIDRRDAGAIQVQFDAFRNPGPQQLVIGLVRLEQGENVSLETAMAAVKALERDVALIPRFSRLEVKR